MLDERSDHYNVRLVLEVNKWDDSGNDIILLSKEMCWMMMDMSDFTK